MENIVAVLTQNILPIFLVAAFGYALRRWLAVDKQSLSSAVFNVFSPALVFSSLVSSQLPGDELANLALFAAISVFAIGALGFGAARLFRFSRIETAAFVIAVMFGNTGNYGLTLNQLRYGQAGLSRAIVYFTTTTVILYTAGIFIAAMGQMSWREGLSRLLRLPPIYAGIAAILVYSFNIPIPAPIMSGIEVTGAGAIPVMLVVLGMQMADTHGAVNWRLALPAVSLRLLAAPLLAAAVALGMGLQGLNRATSIIEASMPTAVFTIILATEFDLRPTAVTSIVVLSTLLSPLTVAATITLLGI
ncbi:MAG: AEC family transporter [Chloroflexi bacterium]|nr:AEC family transporter [Chloroflexota bacterium]